MKTTKITDEYLMTVLPQAYVEINMMEYGRPFDIEAPNYFNKDLDPSIIKKQTEKAFFIDVKYYGEQVKKWVPKKACMMDGDTIVMIEGWAFEEKEEEEDNRYRIVRETAKAIELEIKKNKVWCPKSICQIENNIAIVPQWFLDKNK